MALIVRAVPTNNSLHLSRATGTPACFRNLGALAGFAVPRTQVKQNVRHTKEKDSFYGRSD